MKKNKPCQFIISSIVAGFISSSEMATAAVLTFDSMATSPTSGIEAPNPLEESGYTLIRGSGTALNAFQDGWQNYRGSSNGTTSLTANSNSSALFSLRSINSNTFQLNSIDIGEIFHSSDFAYPAAAQTVDFIGKLEGGGMLNLTFSRNLSLPNFQTVLFSSEWKKLVSVDISADTKSNFGTYINFDNISVTASPLVATVPVPTTVWLFGSGFIGLMGVARKRKFAS